MSPSRRPESPAEGDRDASAPSNGAIVVCPHCDSRDVVLESAFGSNLMTRQYYCRRCRTVFEWVKRTSEERPGGWLD